MNSSVDFPATFTVSYSRQFSQKFIQRRTKKKQKDLAKYFNKKKGRKVVGKNQVNGGRQEKRQKTKDFITPLFLPPLPTVILFLHVLQYFSENALFSLYNSSSSPTATLMTTVKMMSLELRN